MAEKRETDCKRCGSKIIDQEFKCQNCGRIMPSFTVRENIIGFGVIGAFLWIAVNSMIADNTSDAGPRLLTLEEWLELSTDERVETSRTYAEYSLKQDNLPTNDPEEITGLSAMLRGCLEEVAVRGNISSSETVAWDAAKVCYDALKTR